jgi:hypothetical protein
LKRIHFPDKPQAMEGEGAFLIGALIGWIVVIVAAWMVGESRGRPGAGFLCGLVLGPLGIVVALFLQREKSPESKRPPGSPTRRERRMPVKRDPLEEWEEKQRRQ